MNKDKDLKKLERKICCVDGQVEDLAALVDQLAEDLAELIESGAGASFEQVTNYAALPAAGSHTGEYFHVLNSQGTSWLPGSLGGTYYSKGFYYSTGTDWVFVGEVPYQATQATVDAGTDNTQFVTASTLANAAQWNTKVSGTGANGQVAFWSGTNTQSGDNALYWDNVNKELGIGNAAPASRLHVTGLGLTSATASFIAENSGGTDKLVVKDNGSIEIGKNDSGTTQSTASITVISGDADTGLALVPKGTGAITAQVPDGTAVGGNARGNNAVDLQLARLAATQVASGANSFVVGSRSTASGPQSIAMGTSTSTGTSSVAIGGHPIFGTNTASGVGSAALGGVGNTASGAYSFATGDTNRAEKNGSTAMGMRSVSYLHSQRAVASGIFTATAGDAQTSDIRLFRLITGTAATELTLDKGAPVAGNRAIINLPTGSTAGRLWNAKVQIAAICTAQGDGTVTAGEAFIGNYAVGISRIGTTTSLIGTVQNLHTPQTSTNMATAVVDITADDTNEALKIEFTPPTTAGSTTVIRVVATVYLTEVGY